MDSVQKYQYEELKKGKLYAHQIDNCDEWTDEMKWDIVKNFPKKIPEKMNLTKEMYEDLIGRGIIFAIGLDKMPISEEAWIKGIKAYKNKSLIDFCRFIEIVKKYVTMTSQLALEICLICPALYSDKDIKKMIKKTDLEKITESFIKKLEKGEDPHYELDSDLPMSEEQWKVLLKTNRLTRCIGEHAIKNYINERNDVPQFVRDEIIKYSHYEIKYMKDLSKEEIVLWINTNKKDIESGTLDSFIKENIHSKNMSEVLKEEGWFIKYLKNPSQTLCKASIDCNPENIQYIKKPSEKVCIYALSKDKNVLKYITKTKAICDYLKISFDEEKDIEYPEKYYFIKFNENVCDESNIIKTCIVEGKDMEEFMSGYVKVSFGNLDDYEEREISKIAKITPITEEEIKVLKKFGVDKLESGFFNFDED